MQAENVCVSKNFGRTSVCLLFVDLVAAVPNMPKIYACLLILKNTSVCSDFEQVIELQEFLPIYLLFFEFFMFSL